MNRTTRIISATAAGLAMMALSGSAWADCGLKPNVPTIPADGNTVSGKEMENTANEFDAYQTKFIEFNDCITKEYNDTATKFKEVITAYQAKAKKK